MALTASLRRATLVAAALALLGLLAAPLAAAGGGDDGAASSDRSNAGSTRSGATVAGASSERSGSAAGGSAAPGSSDDSVDVLTSSRDAVRARVADLDRQARAQFQELVRVNREVDVANLAALAAGAKVERAEKARAAARRDVHDYAVEAYIRPPAQDALAVLSISALDDASYAREVMEIMADEKAQVTEVLKAKEAAAAQQSAAAAAKATTAREAARASRAELDELERLRDRQASVAADLDRRLDAALAEAAALRAVDAAAADDLTARETELRTTGPVTPTKVASADTSDGSAASGGSSGGGSSGGGRTPTTTAPRRPTPAPPSGTVTWQDVTRVGGIWVHRSIASRVSGLLSAASAAGYRLSGGGFRDPAEQIRLRQAHCGPTQYDIYSKPASQCTPPTAPPGMSMHERGLAIDFMWNGAIISSRSSPAFQWLMANASRFGFYNLPSEPWHWSVNGS